MLRQDEYAGFIQVGMFAKKYRFQAKGYRSTQVWTHEQYQQLWNYQMSHPANIMAINQPRRIWWMFRGRFYWESEGLTSNQVEALLIQREEQKQRKIDRAMAAAYRTGQPSTYQREPIPAKVRMFVWQRDKGRCVKCGSQEKLEFDHIIPVSMGGSSTARNIQLLCESCNRSKGANIS